MLRVKNDTKRLTEIQTLYSLKFVESPIFAKPFLKWAGGKGQLINQLISLLPYEFNEGKITKYVEPFIGGGALFFYIARSFQHIEKFFISDINPELILAYKTIQKDVESLIFTLKKLETHYHSLDANSQKDFFYTQRKNFNEKLHVTNFSQFQSNWLQRTVEIIFLNRTCFNGLFRVNSKGEFNVPFGDYKNPKICDAENLREVSALLQKTEIYLGDFTVSDKFADSTSFVYFDPPYRPLSKTANFTSYSKFEFGDTEQKRLANYYQLLSKKKAKLMLSNSDSNNNNSEENFLEVLYKDFRIERVDAIRAINSKSDKRGKIKELVILNY